MAPNNNNHINDVAGAIFFTFFFFKLLLLNQGKYLFKIASKDAKARSVDIDLVFLLLTLNRCMYMRFSPPNIASRYSEISIIQYL